MPPDPTFRPAVEFEAVRVAAAHRGQRLGHAMLSWAIGQARERGCGLVQPTSDRRRSAAIRFYESLGFQPTHEGMKLPLWPGPAAGRLPPAGRRGGMRIPDVGVADSVHA